MMVQETMAQGLETGGFAVSGAFAPSSRLVVATYNIRYAVGAWLITGGILRRAGVRLAQPRAEAVRRNLHRAAAALQGQPGFPAPDILALQEADKESRRAGGVHIARELAQLLRWHYVFAPSRLPRDHAPEERQWYLAFEENLTPDDPGDTGVALLSRFPCAAASRIDLPWRDCPWRPRTGVEAVYRIHEQELRVFNAHIDPHAPLAGQLAQHETILAQAERAAGPVVLLGDFNTLTPGARRETRRFLQARGFCTPVPDGTATWRAGFFTNHTDWIFLRGARLLRWGVARRVRRISDHWPVWAEIELTTG